MIKNILFTGGGGVGNELIWRKLNKKYKLFFCDLNIENIDPQIPNKSKLKICNCRSRKYLSEIQNICKKFKIDLIVPGIDEELEKLSKNKNKLPKIFLPNLKVIKICNNKWLMNKFCIEKKILTPLIFLASKLLKKHKKKIIAKPIYGRGSKDNYLMNSFSQAKVLSQFFKRKKITNKFIFQDFIDGIEYTITCYKNQNKIIILPFKVISKKGITNNAEFVNDNKIKYFSKEICKLLDSNNIINIQIIKKINKLYLIEINPRISTTFCMMISNNIDPFNNKNLNSPIKKEIS